MRFAVIGAGFGEIHLSWLAESGAGSAEVLCYRNDKSRAQALADKYGIPRVSSDALGVIKDGAIDAIAVVTPPNTHEELAVAGLDRGLLVICDKPISTDLESAERMARQAGVDGARAYVTFQWRTNQALRALRATIREGRIGRLFRLDLEFHHDFLGGPATLWPWRHDRRLAGAGALADQGVHLFDTMRWLSPARWRVAATRVGTVFPQRRYGGRLVAGETEDMAELWLSSDAEVSARIYVCRASAGYRRIRVIAQGEDGTAVASLDPGNGSGRVSYGYQGEEGLRIEEFGEDRMNIYRALLDDDGDPSEVADFTDALEAQKLLDEALQRVVHHS